MRYWNMARQRYCCGLARCWRALRLSADRAENAARKRALFGALIEESGSHMTSPLEERVLSEPVSEVGFSGLAIRHDSERFMDDNRSGKAISGSKTAEFQSLPLGSFSCYLDLKLLIILSFLPSAGLAAGEFTVYKKSRSTALSADPAKNLILFSYLESQGAHANLP